MTIASVLGALKSTSQSFDHEWIVPILEFKRIADAFGFSTTINNLVSSANNLMLQYNIVNINKKKQGT